MFARCLSIERIDREGIAHACPIRQLDNFSMRSFTNDAIFDDTLPVGDGLLEAGFRVPVGLLQEAMQDWFRRKGYLGEGETLRVEEVQRQAQIPCRDEEREATAGATPNADSLRE